MTAVITRRGDQVTALDVFCGFGGSSQGIHAEGADVVGAANHNELAIECHAANFPDTEHFRADLVDPDAGDYMDPVDLPPARFAWFSPACTHHSQANAKKLYQHGRQASLFDQEDEYDEAQYVNSERSRVTMSCVLRYADRHRPDIIAVENVVEVCQWGPGRDGSTYLWWLNELNKLGYSIKELFLNSQFFPPCPQSRDRIYIVAWRKDVPKPDLDYRPHAHCVPCDTVVEAHQMWNRPTKTWPRPRWGKYNRQYHYGCPRCGKRVEPVAWPAYTAIDWTNLGATLGERDRPLADKTVDRIRRGLAKFRNGPPVLIPAKSVFGSDRTVVEPLATQTTQQERALVTDGHPFVIKNNGDATETKYRSQSGALPFGALTASPTQGVVLPAAGHTAERPGQTRARHISDQLFTQHATQAFGFASMPATVEMRGGGSVAAGQHAVADPLHTVTAGGFHHGLMTEGDTVLDGAMFQKINGDPGDTAWHLPHEDPLNTITGRDTTGLVVLPWLDQYRSDPMAVTEQMATVMTHMRHALASIEPVALDRITDEDLESVRFRMLDPDPELRRAMAFGDEYTLIGNKSQMTSGLGNAVTPPVAAWITRQCLAALGGGTTNRAAA